MIYLVGTSDTKAAEIGYLAAMLRKGGRELCCVDVSTLSSGSVMDVSAREVAEHHPNGTDAVLGSTDRGHAVAAMAEAFAVFSSITPPYR